MTGSTSAHRWAWSGVVLALLVAALVALGWTWITLERSSASFADREVFAGNHLGAGTVDIAVGDDTIGFAAANMAAGDVATGRLEVVNGGTLPVRFVLSASSNGGPLLDVLEVVAWRGTQGCASAPPESAPRWHPLQEPVPDLDSPASDPPSDPPPGSSLAHRLAPGETSLLCLRGELPLTASSAAQGQRLDLLLTVTAVHDIAATDERDDGPSGEGTA